MIFHLYGTFCYKIVSLNRLISDNECATAEERLASFSLAFRIGHL